MELFSKNRLRLETYERLMRKKNMKNINNEKKVESEGINDETKKDDALMNLKGEELNKENINSDDGNNNESSCSPRSSYSSHSSV